MLDSPTLDMSFSGLKTAVRVLTRSSRATPRSRTACAADIAREFEDAVVDVLAAKSLAALAAAGRSTLVVAGGVGANLRLRERLTRVVGARGGRVLFPRPAFCTDNGAMIALVGALACVGAARRTARSRAAALGAGGRLTSSHRCAARRQRPIALSSPCTSLRMFSRWRQNSSAAMTTHAQVVSVAPNW